MDDLREWLYSRSKDYHAGVKLYLKYGRDRTLIALFTKEHESDFKRTRLQQAIKDLLQPANAADTVPASIRKKPALLPFFVAHKGWPNPITNPVIKSLHDQFLPLYAELMNLQARIYEVALQAENGDPLKKLEACQMAHRIMDLDDELDDIYSRRDYFLQHDHLPIENEPEIVGDPVRWATERQNALRYIREYKAKLRKDPNNKLAPGWQQKILDWEKLVDHYNKLLKLDE